MTTRLRLELLLIGTLLSGLVLSAPAQAQNYPDHPIAMVVPFPAGGLTDVPARVAATMMSAKIGQNMELDAIAAVVVGGTLLIGGRGTIVGTVLGVLIFTTLTNVFTQNNLSSSAQSVAKGLIIVVAVLLQQRLAARSNSGSP